MGVSFANIDIGGVLTGAGQFMKDIRTALTGKEPLDATKAAELALKVQEMENSLEAARMNVVLAEASSQDKWTSRARPAFMYVIYVLILSSIPMGIVYAINPQLSENITTGFQGWLKAIPSDLYMLFGAGYLGYGAFRTVDKKYGVTK